MSIKHPNSAGSISLEQPTRTRRPLPLHTKILIGLVVGAVIGIAVNLIFGRHPNVEWTVRNITYPAGQVFLRMIFMVVIPLIFSALTLGVAQLGDVRRLGRVGLKTFGYTLIVTSVSVIIGLTLVNTIQPGRGLPEESRSILLETFAVEAADKVERAAEAKSAVQTLVDIIPRNPFEDIVGAFDSSYTGGGILSVMFFSLVLGVALALSDQQKTGTLLSVLEGIYEAVMKIIGFAMKLAPYGVAALLFSVTARLGFDVIRLLIKYVLVVLVGLAIHQFIVYSLLVRSLARISPLGFFRSVREVMITAFSTSSSNATLPTAIRVTEQNLGVPRHITGFVLTLGSTANQNGTALYEGVTVLFLAQFFGVDLTFAEQVTVVLMSVLAGIGTAGVPGGSLPVIVLVLEAVGVPGEGIGIILGIDRLLDMCRTVLNVTGDITAAAYVARSEGYELRTEGSS
jgi:DAACS family dicarboxylate/amino acid:cation (Na+ or H+) symporter